MPTKQIFKAAPVNAFVLTMDPVSACEVTGLAVCEEHKQLFKKKKKGPAGDYASVILMFYCAATSGSKEEKKRNRNRKALINAALNLNNKM